MKTQEVLSGGEGSLDSCALWGVLEQARTSQQLDRPRTTVVDIPWLDGLSRSVLVWSIQVSPPGSEGAHREQENARPQIDLYTLSGVSSWLVAEIIHSTSRSVVCFRNRIFLSYALWMTAFAGGSLFRASRLSCHLAHIRPQGLVPRAFTTKAQSPRCLSSRKMQRTASSSAL